MTNSRFCLRVLSAIFAGGALMVAACGGGSATAEPPGLAATEAATAASTATVVATATGNATADPVRSATSTATAAGSAVPAAADARRVMASIDELAVQIGIRETGTAAEREAATYIESQFAAAGYDATIEPFTATTRVDSSSAQTADGVTVRPFMMSGSASGEATGRLVYGGLGSTADLAKLDVQGAVLLVDRGVLPFEQKARNAQAAGAVGLLIANNEDGAYGGSLGSLQARIPVVSIRRDEGDLLKPLAEPQRSEGARLTLKAEAGQVTVESQNVVGRAGATCEMYLGAHYDSVPEGPGANDNASGAAMLIEMARVHRTDGLCVVAFGAEEIGLFGSRAFVKDHGVTGVRWMLNFDMVGRLDGPIIVGDAGLTQEILDALNGQGLYPIHGGSFPPNASSDHVTFSDAGVPAVTFNSGDDAAIHTSSDTVDRVSPDALDAMLGVVDTAVTALLGQ